MAVKLWKQFEYYYYYYLNIYLVSFCVSVPYTGSDWEQDLDGPEWNGGHSRHGAADGGA